MIWKSLISTTVLARTILSKQSFRLHNFKMSTFALNPLLKEWQTPFGIPPFKEIKPESFEEAFDVALSDHLNEIKSIADSNTPPSFTETIEALDKAGGLLSRVQKVFYNLCSSCSSTELQSVQLKWAAPLAAHYSAIYTLPGLFSKIDTIYSQRTQLGLNSEQVRLVERLHLDFTRAGAKFDPASQKRYTEIMQKLAELTTKFTQNIIADESDLFISLKKDDLSGLPDFLQQASRQAAIDRGNNEEYIITLSRSLVVPFLTFSDRRDLREKAWRMWTSRGELDSSRNNLAIAKEILILRAEQAKMHGYKSYADYATADTMAGSPNSVSELLEVK
jgi:peptidyl-dipeptidase Dcp